MDVIRARRSADEGSCAELLADVHALSGYPLNWPTSAKAWLNPPSLLHAWVAVSDGVAVGHIAVVAGTAYAELTQAAERPGMSVASVAQLFVHPEARGRSLGTRLMGAAADYAVTHRMSLALDVVDAPASAAAIRLYEGLGWRCVRQRVADWLAPDGQHPRVRLYVAPPGTQAHTAPPEGGPAPDGSDSSTAS